MDSYNGPRSLPEFSSMAPPFLYYAVIYKPLSFLCLIVRSGGSAPPGMFFPVLFLGSNHITPGREENRGAVTGLFNQTLGDTDPL